MPALAARRTRALTGREQLQMGGGDAHIELDDPGRRGDPRIGPRHGANLQLRRSGLSAEMAVGRQLLFRLQLYLMESVPGVGGRPCRDVHGKSVLSASASQAIRPSAALMRGIDRNSGPA